MPRFLSRLFPFSAIALSLGLFMWLLLSPDPVGNMFLQAGQLELLGQIPPALERYQLIAAHHPESSYAPRALMRVGDLLAAQGRKSGDKAALRASVEAYLKLARLYPKDTFVLLSLQSAATIAIENLKDRPLARSVYGQIIKVNGPNSEVGAGARVKLAQLFIDEGNGKIAQAQLQGILRRWSNNATVGAEAQYLLGLCYETVFHKKDWASRAYDLVIARFPTSQWATDAKERLGLISFEIMRGVPTRRVLLDIAPLPDESEGNDAGDGAIWNALRLALSARGMSGDPTLIRGYSLAPFSAGLNLDNPGEEVNAKGDAWQNVAGAAGFRFSINGGGREDEALRELQDDLDAAHLPLVCWQNDGKATWSLAVGYDSERGEVMLQNRGAQFDTLAAKAWAPLWKTPSTFGKNYTLISLVPKSKTPEKKPSLTPTPPPTPKPGQTPAPVVGGPPEFIWHIAPLSERVPIESTAHRAAILLLRSGTDTRLLNVRALDFLATTLDGAVRELRAPAPSVEPTATPQPLATDAPSIYDPTPTPAVTPVPSSPRELLARAQTLWPFWNAPAKDWIAKRRECANWCRLAALKTKDDRFNRAADAFEQSADALERAAQSALALNAQSLGEDSNALESIASECRRARDAERSAAGLLG